MTSGSDQEQEQAENTAGGPASDPAPIAEPPTFAQRFQDAFDSVGSMADALAGREAAVVSADSKVSVAEDNLAKANSQRSGAVSQAVSGKAALRNALGTAKDLLTEWQASLDA